MKTIIRKAYWNYEKEEKWLNDMSAKGLALTDYSWCRYAFTDSRPGEYIYRIELLKNLPSNPESRKYLQFMEENGVEHIASYMRWVYFRKKAADGAFDIYSDAESRIQHYKRVSLLWLILGLAELVIGLSNLALAIGIHFLSQSDVLGNLIGGIICTCLGVAFLSLSHPLRKKIKRLKKERVITE